MKYLVTGGAGFIGSAFVRMLLSDPKTGAVVNLDKLTYAGNLENLTSVAGDPRYRFAHGDIGDAPFVDALIKDTTPDVIVNFAAESHVDRSILAPSASVDTNVRGTFVMLEAARQNKVPRFLQVSTDEVYGSIEEPHEAGESDMLCPSSPYSASKAGGDMIALSYHTTFGLNVSVTRASNNYGPYQFPEKLIPLMISNAMEDKPLPIYGDGMQVRDWLWVDDHCRAILATIEKGRAGEVYNIGGSRAEPNINVVKMILHALGKPDSLMERVKDRPGHDRRYALTSDKLTATTGWAPLMPFEQGLAATIEWYRSNPAWIANVKSGEYRRFYDANYANRTA